ncbi:MAG: hypothetical protein HC887_00650 [Desulfobacteraceae bacterium]|nr:hypothetical protein [Desulfobacteraceae bacterium]
MNPNFTDVYDNLAHQYQHACDWQAYNALLPKIEALNKDRLSKGLRVVENPFSHVSRYADPAYNFEIIKSWADAESAISPLERGRGVYLLRGGRGVLKSAIYPMTSAIIR